MNNVLPRVRQLRGSNAAVPFVAVCKEIAPVADAAEDHGPKGLGVGDFQYKYFGGNDMVLDAQRLFYKAMGNRKFTFKFKSPWYKPWALFKEIRGALAALKAKGVTGNLRGIKGSYTAIQGGVIVVGPSEQGVTYVHFEEGDPDVDMPCDDIVRGVEEMEFF